MKRLLAMSLCLFVSVTAFASDKGYSVIYDGGSVKHVRTGSTAKLYIDRSQIRFVGRGMKPLLIPAVAITEISYGQSVHRRVGADLSLAVMSFGLSAVMLLKKPDRDYVGITWQDAGVKNGFAVQCDKTDYNRIITGLESITGKKALDSTALAATP